METKAEIKTNEKTKDYTLAFNRSLYIGFLLLGVVQFIFRHSYSDLAMNLGIGLAFDPFDQKVAWPQRPFYQKALPVIQLGIAAAALGMTLAGK